MKSNNWVNHLAYSNLYKHRKRNIFSILSLIVGLTASFLIVGFSMNAENSIKEQCYQQLDYGSLSISKDVKTESTNGGLSIIRSTRPSRNELVSLSKELNDFHIELSFDYLLSNVPSIKYQKIELKEFTYEPIYSYIFSSIDKSLLIEGRFPRSETLNEVVINKKASEEITKLLGGSSIDKVVKIYQERESVYYYDEEPIIDYFIYDKSVKIVGVVDDLNFLSTPKIYYSYLAFKNYLSLTTIDNLSLKLEKDISWLDRVEQCNNSDEISSYSYRLFIKDYKKKNEVVDKVSLIKEPFSITSGALTRSEALINLIKAATTGMELFLIIALLGTSLIMGIVSFSFYSEERKNIAILSCLGAKSGDINDIYCTESVLIGISAYLISLIVSFPLQMGINFIVSKLTSFNNIIQIPLLKFMNIPFGFPLIVLMATLMVCLFSTLLPIFFSKKITLKEELKDE